MMLVDSLVNVAKGLWDLIVRIPVVILCRERPHGTHDLRELRHSRLPQRWSLFENKLLKIAFAEMLPDHLRQGFAKLIPHDFSDDCKKLLARYFHLFLTSRFLSEKHLCFHTGRSVFPVQRKVAI